MSSTLTWLLLCYLAAGSLAFVKLHPKGPLSMLLALCAGTTLLWPFMIVIETIVRVTNAEKDQGP